MIKTEKRIDEAVILVIVGRTKSSASAVFAKINVIIPVDNRNKSYKASEADIGRLSGSTGAKNQYFRGLTEISFILL